MRIRSHLDPTMYVIFLHVDGKEYDEDFTKLVRSLKSTRGIDVRPVLDALRDRERRVLAHERYHFWQGLRLPFLHTYAVTTMRLAFLGAREIARTTEDWGRWSDLGAHVSGFDRLDQRFTIAATASGELVFGRQEFPNRDFALNFSTKDMLECAASIFDYQMSCENIADISDPIQFTRWSKRNPAYLNVFNFLADFFDSKKLALRTTLPLINASFHTSYPERAFAEIVGRVWGNFVGTDAPGDFFLSQKEPCRWPDLFGRFLAELDYDYEFDSNPQKVDLDNFEFYYMSSEKWLGVQLGGGFQHPFLGPLAEEWQRRAQSTPSLEYYIDLPGYVSNEEAHKFAYAADPQLRIVRFFLPDGPDKVFAVGDGLVGPAFKSEAFSSLSASEFRAFVLDSLATYGAFRKATGANMTDAARTCYHSDCPLFEANYCNCYPLIPERFEDCGFPDRLTEWVTANRR